MARQQNDREDLLREATALVERAELRVEGFDDPVVVGFRANGACSAYFGADPVYHFNVAGELRRGYQGEQLYKSERGRLVSLNRKRVGGEVHLIRHELANQETAEYLADAAYRLSALRAALDAGRASIAGQVPLDGDIVGRVRAWLVSLPAPLRIAASPRVE